MSVEPNRVLVVANQTATGPALRDEILRRTKEGPHSFTLVVPATPPHEHAVWTEEEATEIAQRQLAAALQTLGDTGAEITGHVGDASPVQAIADALLTNSFDEILLSTLPSGVSRWLKQDLPHRVERRFGLPLTVVTAQSAQVDT